ncbi:Transposon Ty3-I Gag-Pol polyprotein [Folsomia candida]|uniref:RNA-directed DNA polymerase n=1 Tax=Folsomia candida TaxID=158441 RepID=A0A226EAQ3_FOLCA|nr:Transposon Ty3-I Gag-Pol polyprotein [Folsomia candida]
MEVDDHTSVLDLLKSPKPELEKASVYLQRLRAAMSEEYTRHAEPDIIRLLMDNLDPSLRQFLECKGPPLTYGDLVSLVKHYEDRGLQKTLTPQLQPPVTIISPTVPPQSVGLDAFAGLHQAPVTPLAPPTAQPKPVNNATDGGLSLGVNLTNVKNMQGLLNHLSDLQAAIMRLNVSPSQNHGSRSRPDQSQDNRAPRPNGQRPSFECYYCGIRGHRIIECRKKMMAFNLTAKGVVAMVGIVITIPPVLATAAITAAATTLLVTTAVAMTTVATVAEMTPPAISVAIQTFRNAAMMNLPVAVTTSIIILRIVTTRDVKTISGMSVQRVPLPVHRPRRETPGFGQIDLPTIPQAFKIYSTSIDFSANHGPVTIDTFINNQRITATVDNGAKASIITEALAVGLPRINPNLPYRLSDFGNHTIRDCGLVILPLKIGTQQVTYPFFVVPSSPCPLLLGHDFQEHFLLSSNESFRCLMSPILGSVPYTSAPQRLFHSCDNKEIMQSLNRNMDMKLLDASQRTPATQPEQPLKPQPLLPSLTSSPAASGPLPPPPPPLPSALLSPPPAALSPPPAAAAELSPPPFLMDLTKLKINPNISPPTRAKLLSLITEFKHIFSWDPTKLGRTDRVEFDIDTGDHPPIRMQQFNHPEKIHRDIKSHVDKLLAQGIVRPIRGSWSSPCFFVPKKDDDGNLTSQRFTVDYRSLNRITKKIQWPQTRIDDIFQSLRGKKYFTSLDFTSGYYQVPMTPEAQEKATFVTREGTFAPTVLPFGVSNGPARFAELLDEVLSGLKVSAGATEEEALEKLRLIFERIAAEGLTLKPYKCDFLQDEINLLGFSLSAMGTKPDEKKLRGVSQLKPPTTGHKVKKLVAFFSYFRKYIPNFSRIVHPLQCLSTIRGKITWTEEHQAAFDTVIARLLSRPVLRLFDPALPTLLETDASSYGLGAGLFQFYEGEKHPVAFISRTLSVAEKRYPSVMLELTAICWALKRLRPLIYGVPLSIATDCHGICWLLQGSKKELNSRLSSMVVCLMDYTIVEIRHVSGKKHECADFLSRYPTEDFQPNRDELDDLPILTIGSLNLMSSQDDVLFKRDNQYNRLTLVIPSKLIPSVLDECHDSPFSGHMGFTKTYDRIKQRYWFPGMRRQIMRYVATCSKCQFRKSPRSKPNGLFQCIKVPKNAFQRVQIDVAGPFPASKSNKKYIITASCYLTKWLETEDIINFLVKLICRHGVPAILQSDKGTIFTSDLLSQLSSALGIKHLLSTAYHPQSQGQVERSHAVLNDCIQIYLTDSLKSHSDWDTWLPHITFAINSSKHTTIGFSPFEFLYGREVVLPTESAFIAEEYISLEKFLSHVRSARTLAWDRIQHSQEVAKFYYDKKRKHIEFPIGSQVLCRKYIQKKGLAAKLMQYWFGPYMIKRKLSDVNYIISATMSNGRVITETAHVEKLKLYNSRSTDETTVSTFSPSALDISHDASTDPPQSADHQDNADYADEEVLSSLDPPHSSRSSPGSPTQTPSDTLTSQQAQLPTNNFLFDSDFPQLSPQAHTYESTLSQSTPPVLSPVFPHNKQPTPAHQYNLRSRKKVTFQEGS